jgi:hypothetical protein
LQSNRATACVVLEEYKEPFEVFFHTLGGILSSLPDSAQGEEWTKITFSPDLAKFGMVELEDDIIALMTRRAYDIAGAHTVWPVHGMP